MASETWAWGSHPNGRIWTPRAPNGGPLSFDKSIWLDNEREHNRLTVLWGVASKKGKRMRNKTGMFPSRQQKSETETKNINSAHSSVDGKIKRRNLNITSSVDETAKMSQRSDLLKRRRNRAAAQRQIDKEEKKERAKQLRKERSE
ncbi:hypothetical protein AVEN_47514-1 [Araneus ventricosus]|uniref:Uncharacterized protein n=1 Tax=Araneus ventricosus TaxID=182803 RepID=A0A4Y2FGB4_ARAVE|nr:hypothetical protein AVEN_47514-1 [Araneus ventricosus]